MRRIRAATCTELTEMATRLELVPSATFSGIALVVDGTVQILVGYDRWTPGACEMHLWVKDPKFMGRDILREAFRYPFEQGGVQTVLGIVRSDNPEALRFDLGIGFQPAAVIKDAYGPGVDMHILQLPRHACRWYSQ